MDLITNRTAADVERYQYLKNKGFDNLTDAEKAEWLSNMKGAYNYSDLNRVEAAVLYVADRLREYGYHLTIETHGEWSMGDVPTLADMTKYLANVKAIRTAFATLSTTPQVPDNMHHLSYQKANNIEQIIFDVDYLITNMMNSMFYSNDLISGEV